MKNLIAIAILLVASFTSLAQTVISTIAGTGFPGYTGDGGPATDAMLHDPINVFVDAAGNVYVSDMLYEQNIRKIDASTGIITTIVGTGSSGFSGDGGPATDASLNGPAGIFVNSAGDVFIADSYNGVIRKINGSTGIIRTIAGNGSMTYSGDGGPATDAGLFLPNGITGDASGNIYFSEYGSSVVRKVSLGSGLISTIAGTGVTGTSSDGGPATSSQLNRPAGLCVDASGNIYVADVSSHRIRKISTTGIITTVAGNGTNGYSGDEGPATLSQLYNPSDVCIDGSSNLYVADVSNNVVRKISPSGVITTVAGDGTAGYSGDGGDATTAQLWGPGGVSIYAGRIYIADAGNNVIRMVVSSSGINDKKKELSIKTYPNPSCDYLKIQSSSKIKNINLFDLTGAKVLSIVNDNKHSSYFDTIDLKFLSSGLYILVIDGFMDNEHYRGCIEINK